MTLTRPPFALVKCNTEEETPRTWVTIVDVAHTAEGARIMGLRRVHQDVPEGWSWEDWDSFTDMTWFEVATWNPERRQYERKAPAAPFPRYPFTASDLENLDNEIPF